jgi:hypothetical protein
MCFTFDRFNKVILKIHITCWATSSLAVNQLINLRLRLQVALSRKASKTEKTDLRNLSRKISQGHYKTMINSRRKMLLLQLSLLKTTIMIKKSLMILARHKSHLIKNHLTRIENHLTRIKNLLTRIKNLLIKIKSENTLLLSNHSLLIQKRKILSLRCKSPKFSRPILLEI